MVTFRRDSDRRDILRVFNLPPTSLDTFNPMEESNMADFSMVWFGLLGFMAYQPL